MPPGKAVHGGPYLHNHSTHINKNVKMVDKIKHIFIVLVLSTKSVFKH